MKCLTDTNYMAVVLLDDGRLVQAHVRPVSLVCDQCNAWRETAANKTDCRSCQKTYSEYHGFKAVECTRQLQPMFTFGKGARC